MAGPVQITGGQQFANLSKVLRAAGGDLRKEYLRDIRKATAPAKEGIPNSARATLPRRGGLNETVANDLKVTTRTSLSGPTAKVSIIATDPPHHDIKNMNLGRIRKPLFGDRDHWYSQSVPPLFFTNYCLSLAPEARRQIAAGTDRVLAAIARTTL